MKLNTYTQIRSNLTTSRIPHTSYRTLSNLFLIIVMACFVFKANMGADLLTLNEDLDQSVKLKDCLVEKASRCAKAQLGPKDVNVFFLKVKLHLTFA